MRVGDRTALGPGAGSARRPARVRVGEAVRAETFVGTEPLVVAEPRAVLDPLRAVLDPLLELPPPPRLLTTEGGRLEASAAVPGPGVCPPVEDGMFSQYWLLALAVEFEQGPPGWLDDAAYAFWASGAAQATTRTRSGCLSLRNMDLSSFPNLDSPSC
jgi:hypothetical protein